MLRIEWQNQWLTVRRIVFHTGEPDTYTRALTAAAGRHGLSVSDPATDPRPGDFWIGCHPRGGWGDADPSRIGWASIVEVPVAVAAVRGELRSVERPVRVPDAEAEYVAPFVFGAV